MAAAVLAIGFALPLLAADPPGPAPLSLSSALRQVAKNSEQAVNARLDVQKAEQDTRKVQSSYYPSLELSGGHFNRDNQIIALFGALAAPTTEQNFWQYKLGARELLWDGGKRKYALQATRNMVDAADQKGIYHIVSAQLDGMGAYLKALAYKARQGVVAKRIQALESHLKVVNDLYSQGMVARNDLLETQVRLRTVEDQASQVKNQEAVAVQSLNRIMGRSPAAPLALPDGLPAPPMLPGTLLQYKKEALARNPLVKAIKASVKAASAQLTARKRDYYPNVFAEAAHTYEQNQYLEYPNANYLFVGMSWKFYDGGVRSAKIKEAGIDVQKAQRSLVEARRQVEIKVDQAYRDYRQALQEVKTAETNVTAAAENLRIEEDQYKAGLAKTTDVLDAESVLAESRFALVAQHYSAYMKQGILLGITGRKLAQFYSDLSTSGQEQKHE
ncbi:MAG: TolC family protein [Acidobacteriota bacterium]